MASLQIKTADELDAGDLEQRWRARRAARETAVSRHVLQLFVDRGGPIAVEAIAASVPDVPAESMGQALVSLDADDLIRIQGGQERFASCAVDALGIAPMIGQAVEIRSRCHHCGEPLVLESTPDGARPEGSGIMLWIGQRADARWKVADSL